MTDEKTTKPQADQPQEAAPAQKKGGLMSYIMLGGGFIVIMAAAIGVTLFMMGGGSEKATQPELSDTPAKTEQQAGDSTALPTQEAGVGDSSEEFSFEESPDLLDEIRSNLEMLDYTPTETEIAEEESTMVVEDSLKKANWFKAEDERLDKRAKELDARESKLVALDKEVTKKIATIEQAESTRVANLARLYDDMDPHAVAKLMASLDDATVVAILPRMKNKNASQVLALMPSQRAALLSKQMITIAGDNQ